MGEHIQQVSMAMCFLTALHCSCCHAMVIRQSANARAIKKSPSTALRSVNTNDAQPDLEKSFDPNTAKSFKVVTCSSTACSQKRKSLQMDEFATFSAFYARAQDAAPMIAVEECPCLGACKHAPCVAIEHDDYIGPVALEGMSHAEYTARVFHRVVTETDADRVWSLLEHAINVMGEQSNVTDDDYI